MHIPQYFVYICGVFTLIGVVTVMAALGSYTRMLLKVAKYNHLRSEAELLKQKYHKLQTTMSQTEVQLASLQVLASEVSVAYGITRSGAGREALVTPAEGKGVSDSVEQFELLLKASYTPPPLRQQFLDNGAAAVSRLPLDWPLQGPITGSFGDRLDPFNGEGAFHAGVDISSPYGSPVRAAADGIVLAAARESGYGMALLVDHGRGVRTFYAHLSGFNATPGQAVLGGEIIGFVGRSGRSTGPHLHYEVRIQNTPVNPARFLHNRVVAAHFLGDD